MKKHSQLLTLTHTHTHTHAHTHKTCTHTHTHTHTHAHTHTHTHTHTQSRTSNFQKSVSQCALSMIDMSNDAEVPYVLHRELGQVHLILPTFNETLSNHSSTKAEIKGATHVMFSRLLRDQYLCNRSFFFSFVFRFFFGFKF